MKEEPDFISWLLALWLINCHRNVRGNSGNPSRRGICWPYEMALDDPKGERP